MKGFLKKRRLLVLSIFTRAGVLSLLTLFAMWTEYLNLKVGYNNARLVELSAGSDRPIYAKLLRGFYEFSDGFFSFFGDPVTVMQTNGGMTWSIRVMGVPFTDPVAAVSYMSQNLFMPSGFALGLILPLIIVLLFGRVFCSYICPASLIFFSVARLRKLLEKFFYLPDLKADRGLAWGILIGGLVLAATTSYGVWALILPYFAVGQGIFHALAFGSLSVTLISLAFFTLVDLCLGAHFTCRFLCPTGRLLGYLGKKSLFALKRDESACLANCQSCHLICPFNVNPKEDETRDCSMCGECIAICPTKCLSIKRREK